MENKKEKLIGLQQIVKNWEALPLPLAATVLAGVAEDLYENYGSENAASVYLGVRDAASVRPGDQPLFELYAKQLLFLLETLIIEMEEN